MNSLAWALSISYIAKLTVDNGKGRIDILQACSLMMAQLLKAFVCDGLDSRSRETQQHSYSSESHGKELGHHVLAVILEAVGVPRKNSVKPR